MSNCVCMKPPFDYKDFKTNFIGIDETNGRFGEVSVELCKLCHSKWLRYYVEFEYISKSGRWFKGQISDDIFAKITPETAVETLNDLPWHFCGGSYFNSNGKKGIGTISVD
ncbi:MAG: hypothetical protein GY714_05610 [Desulfobacterales bacterium]|nr:hypothetical protein [Desulfobacterales bacterium]MCP4163374.1 hypothetical protein [Deltaproteobacteria bacterium]